MVKLSDRFSPDWTSEERLLLVIVLTDLIRDDINLGRYSAVGRPNVQSVHEMIVATPKELESYRSDIDELLTEWTKGDPAKLDELFRWPLSDYWAGRVPD
jgi:hypothetical protein